MAKLDLGKVVPEKGIDYFTNADKEEIKDDVLQEIEIPTKVSDLENDSNFIDNTVNDLLNYELKTNTGTTIELNINSSTYVMTLNLKNSAGTIISTGSIDLPLETMVVGAVYDNVNKKIVLSLKNGQTIDVPVGDLVNGLQAEITSNNKLSSDLVDDTNNTHKFVTEGEKSTWNGKADTSDIPTKTSDLTNDSGFLVNETDPVFSASPSAGITNSDISNWNNKQSALSFDSTPTANSNNPVTSGGVYNAIQAQIGNISTVLGSLVTVGGGE